MRRETILAAEIGVIDQRAHYDAACKQILSNKRILAQVLKECVAEFKDATLDEIAERYIEGSPEVSTVSVLPNLSNAEKIKGAATEDTSINEGKILFDIHFFATTPDEKSMGLIINVEAQNQYNPGYVLTKRGVYYCARLLSAQHGTEFNNQEYDKIKKVYSIWICINPTLKFENTINEFRMSEQNIFGNAHEKKENYDLLSVITVCLSDKDPEQENKLLGLLNELFKRDHDAATKKKVLAEKFQIPMTQEIDEEVSKMCNLSEGVYNNGFNKGFNNGYDKGTSEGFGNATIHYLKNLMKELPLQKALDLMGITEKSKREEYTRLLSEKE